MTPKSSRAQELPVQIEKRSVPAGFVDSVQALDATAFLQLAELAQAFDYAGKVDCAQFGIAPGESLGDQAQIGLGKVRVEIEPPQGRSQAARFMPEASHKRQLDFRRTFLGKIALAVHVKP